MNVVSSMQYFHDPVSRRRFRSKREVLHFLKTGKTARYKAKTKLGPSNTGIMSETSTPNGNNASQTKAHEADVNNTPLPSPRSYKQDFSSSSKHEDASRFDYLNPPAKVKWVLTDAAEGSWTPFIDGKEVSEFERKTWAAAFESHFPGAFNSQSYWLAANSIVKEPKSCNSGGQSKNMERLASMLQPVDVPDEGLAWQQENLFALLEGSSNLKLPAKCALSFVEVAEMLVLGEETLLRTRGRDSKQRLVIMSSELCCIWQMSVKNNVS
ncbi:Methyl-CpG-binding domain protein 5 [Asimina triloba]